MSCRQRPQLPGLQHRGHIGKMLGMSQMERGAGGRDECDDPGAAAGPEGWQSSVSRCVCEGVSGRVEDVSADACRGAVLTKAGSIFQSSWGLEQTGGGRSLYFSKTLKVRVGERQKSFFC